jgi:hypothetical protein
MTITERSPTTPQVEGVDVVRPTAELNQRMRALVRAFPALVAGVSRTSTARVAVDTSFGHRRHDSPDVEVSSTTATAGRANTALRRALTALGPLLAVTTFVAAVTVGVLILGGGTSQEAFSMPNCTCVHRCVAPMGSPATRGDNLLSSGCAGSPLVPPLQPFSGCSAPRPPAWPLTATPVCSIRMWTWRPAD